jgi:hypothetical protein
VQIKTKRSHDARRTKTFTMSEQRRTSSLSSIKDQLKEIVFDSEDLRNLLKEFEDDMLEEAKQNVLKSAQDDYEQMTVKQLKAELKKLGLPVVGNKQTLLHRLRDHAKTKGSSKHSSGRTSPAESRPSTPKNENKNKNDDTTSNDDQTSDDDQTNDEKSSDSDSTDLSFSKKKCRRAKQPKFAFKDIEDSLPTFSGENGDSVKKWIREFEEYSEMLQWTELQQFIYAKKQMKKSAKLFVEKELKPKTYAAFRAGIKKEFMEEKNSAKIHTMLAKERKKESESFRTYIYRMIDISSNSNIEEEAIILYIVNGIPDNKFRKSALYESKTISELKQKLKTYTLVNSNVYESTGKKHENKSTIQPINQPTKKESNINDDTRKQQHKSQQPRCFNCGDQQHISAECPHKEKGPKCFKCNLFGHTSNTCKNEKSTSEKKEPSDEKKVMCATTVDNRRYMHIKATIDASHVDAFVDTLSCPNLITDATLKSLNIKWNESEIIELKSAGNGNYFKTLGSTFIDTHIHGHSYKVKFHVVKPADIPINIILGKDFLRGTEIIIKNNIIINITPTPISDIDETIENLFNMMYISPDELDLSHIHDKNDRTTISAIIQQYDPQPIEKCPVELTIKVSDDTPVYSNARRLPYAHKEIVQQQITSWLNDGLIRPSNSNYASPIVLAKKKDGTHRICVDFRLLNKKIIREAYPIPSMDEQIDKLQTCKIFSTLDLKNGFLHVPVNVASRYLTAFSTPYGHYEFNKMPFGLSVGPAVFQKFISTIFYELIKDDIIQIYMDDIIILAQTTNEAIEHLKTVLQIAEKNNLQINWDKCQLLQPRINYLGHIIENGEVRPSKEKSEDVLKFKLPENVKQLQSFLGLSGYFRKFIRNYAMIARPLSDMLRKDAEFKIDEKMQFAFNTLKQCLADEPVLQLYDPNATFELHTDASKHGFGATLLQKKENDTHFHPIHFMSLKTSEQEAKYDSYSLEVLAIIKALSKFRVYLLGKKIRIVTDCNAFAQTVDKKEINPKIARWMMALAEYDYVIEHRLAQRMQHVDALSRMYLITNAPNSMIESLRTAQQNDEHIQSIVHILHETPYKDYIMHNGLLCKQIDNNNLFVVPNNMQTNIIKQTHERGHFGTQKVKEMINKEFFIPELKTKTESVIRNCVPCILSNRKRGKEEGLLNPIPKGDLPMDTLHLDHLGPMPSTNKNYKYILAITDSFTKFVWIFPTKSTEANETIQKLKTVTDVFGNPRRVVTDKGSAFTSNAFSEFCEQQSINKVTTTTGVPRGNGQIERVNSIIIAVLSKMSLDAPTKWFNHTSRVQQYINSTYNRAIDTTPFTLMTGTNMKLPDDPQIKQLIDDEARIIFQEQRDDIRQQSKAAILKIQQENKNQYNKKRKAAHAYNIDDLVAIQRTQFGTGLKLKQKYFGPYKIIKITGIDRYEVQKIGGEEGPRVTTTSADNMKPWAA